MIKFVRRGRMRKVVSTVVAAAMVASLIVVPAFALTPSSASFVSGGTTGLTAVKGVYRTGVNGTLSLSIVGTPGTNAFMQSNEQYAADIRNVTTLNDRYVTGSRILKVMVESDKVQDIIGGSDHYWVQVGPFTGTTTIQGVVDGINAAFSDEAKIRGAFDYSAEAWAELSAETREQLMCAMHVDATFVSSGEIKLTKTYAERWSSVGVDDDEEFVLENNPAGGIADRVFGDSGDYITEDWTWDEDCDRAEGTRPHDYGYDREMIGEEPNQTWKSFFQPTNGMKEYLPIEDFENLPELTFGYYKADGTFVEDAVDPCSGQYTAMFFSERGFHMEPRSWRRPTQGSNGNDMGVAFWTGATTTPVDDGTVVVNFGTGARDASYDCEAGAMTMENRYGNGNFIAGEVATVTVTVPIPTDQPEIDMINGYNGVSLLIPQGFEVVNGPNAEGFDFNFAEVFGPGATVDTTATPYGTLMTISGFYAGDDRLDDLYFPLALKAPTTAGYYGSGEHDCEDPAGEGLKIWIHNPGTPLTASPMVSELILASDEEAGNDWVPIFCGKRCDPVSMYVEANDLFRVEFNADANRAEGKTALVAEGFDRYDNPVHSLNFGEVDVTGDDGADRAYVWGVDPGEWVWKIAETPGVNTATVKVDDARTAAVEEVPGLESFDNTGFGEPAKVVVLPADTTYPDGSTPDFQIQLQDAAGNPTSWLDKHDRDQGPEADLFEVTAHSQNSRWRGLQDESVLIHRGWSKATTGWFYGWPQEFDFDRRAQGPDTWSVSAKHISGSVAPSKLVFVDIEAEEQKYVGKPDHIEITAAPGTPAEYAKGDDLYNNKRDQYEDSAFGVGTADGVDNITLTAKVVDRYGNPVVTGVAGQPIEFKINKDWGAFAILPTGHSYETTMNANGTASVVVKSYEPKLETAEVDMHDGGHGRDRNDRRGHDVDTWFTPVYAETEVKFVPENWANPCGRDKDVRGTGFVYFHGATMDASLAEDAEGDEKDIALADGTDTVVYNATVVDSAFDTPIPNHEVGFSTSFGTFADGKQTTALVTNSDGVASVAVKSAEAGKAYLRAYDALGNDFRERAEFTDYATKFTVDEPTQIAGDRSTAGITVWAENIKSGAKVEWEADCGNEIDWAWTGVYGYDAEQKPVWTNSVDVVDMFVDSDNNGKYDAMKLEIPAADVSQTNSRLESAGTRYAKLGGNFDTRVSVGNVFYNEANFRAVPARPSVNFVKGASIQAETTQFSTTINLLGEGFLPGQSAPEYTDEVKVQLGDIRDLPWDSKPAGIAYVGKDGKLLPSAVLSGMVQRMAPGTYDITVDGLVFEDGLVVKNLFNQGSIAINGKAGGIRYIDGQKSNTVTVHAFGAESFEVWAGEEKLTKSDSKGRLVMEPKYRAPGLYKMTAKIKWEIDDFALARIGAQTDGPETPFVMPRFVTSIVQQDYYVKGHLKYSNVKISKSGRVIKVSGKANGSTEAYGVPGAFQIKMRVQKKTDSGWKTVKTVNPTSVNGAFKLNYKVGSKGTYRVLVSHEDLAHWYRQKTTKSVTIK